MNDLIKKWQQYDSTTENKVDMLQVLRNRIKTDIMLFDFGFDFNNKEKKIEKLDEYLQFTEKCILKLKNGVLTGKEMKELNFLNKIFWRNNEID